MSYQITDTPTALKLVGNGITRLLLKQHIREIGVVKNNTIQIDLGTKKVFIPFADITVPAAQSSADALALLLNDYVYSDTKNRQSDILQQLVSINANEANISANSNNFGNSNNNVVPPVLRVTDDKNPNMVYNGYCNQMSVAIDTADYIIERVLSQDGITMHQFPDGNNTQYLHKWADRETLNYV